MHRIWEFGRSYLLWLISAGLGLVDVLAARGMLRGLAVRLGATRWSLPIIDKFTFIALAIIWVVLILLCESYYQKASIVGIGCLMRRFFRVLAVELGCLALVVLLTLLAV